MTSLTARTKSPTSILASPLMWMIVGGSVVLTAWLFPEAWYVEMFNEHNHMFLNMLAAFYCSACIVAVGFGIWLVSLRKQPASAVAESRSALAGCPYTLNALILACILLSTGAIFVLFSSGALSAFRSAALQGEGQEFRKNQREESLLWASLLLPVSFSIPIIYQCVRSTNRRVWSTRLFYVLVILYCLIVITTTKRNLLVRPVFGCLLVYLVWPSARRLSIGRGLLVMGFVALGCLAAFIALAFVRFGSEGVSSAFGEITRYLVTPYNAASLIINDELVMAGQNTGYYWTQFIWKFPLVSDTFGLEDIRYQWLGPAPANDAFERGPLLADYGVTTGTALPAFACSYVDFNWFGIAPFFFTGILCGFAWRSFKLGELAGLCFYPIIAYSFADWRGNLLFPSPTLGYFLIVYIIIVAVSGVEKSLNNARR